MPSICWPVKHISEVKVIKNFPKIWVKNGQIGLELTGRPVGLAVRTSLMKSEVVGSSPTLVNNFSIIFYYLILIYFLVFTS